MVELLKDLSLRLRRESASCFGSTMTREDCLTSSARLPAPSTPPTSANSECETGKMSERTEIASLLSGCSSPRPLPGEMCREAGAKLCWAFWLDWLCYFWTAIVLCSLLALSKESRRVDDLMWVGEGL